MKHIMPTPYPRSLKNSPLSAGLSYSGPAFPAALFFLLIMAFVTPPFSNYAYGAGLKNAPSGKTAFVDIYKIYSFHPVMQYFDGETGLFLKPLNVKDKLAQKQIIEKRNREYSSIYAQNSAGLFKIKSEMEHIYSQASSVAKTAALLKIEPLTGADGGIDKKATEKRINELESEINDLRKQLDNLALIYKQAAEPLLAVHHLGRAESDKLFKAAAKEIDSAIVRVSAGLDIKNIFIKETKTPPRGGGNYAASEGGGNHGTAVIENIEAAWRYGPDYGPAQRLMSVKNPPAAESQAGPKHGQYIQNENFRRVRELLKARLDSKVTPEASTLAGAPFINEGIDITNDVIIELSKENDISKSAMDKIIEYLSAGSEN